MSCQMAALTGSAMRLWALTLPCSVSLPLAFAFGQKTCHTASFVSPGDSLGPHIAMLCESTSCIHIWTKSFYTASFVAWERFA